MPPNTSQPDVASGHLVGGWLTRPSETTGPQNQPIFYGKTTTHAGKRAEFVKILLDQLPSIEKEAGVLTGLIIEDDGNKDVVYFLNRLVDKALGEKYQKEGAEMRAKLEPLTASQEGGVFKFYSGFMRK
jgi:quinol monooxygenase YgiN